MTPRDSSLFMSEWARRSQGVLHCVHDGVKQRSTYVVHEAATGLSISGWVAIPRRARQPAAKRLKIDGTTGETWNVCFMWLTRQ